MNRMHYLFAAAGSLVPALAVDAAQSQGSRTQPHRESTSVQQAPVTAAPAPVTLAPAESAPISCPGFANTRVIELDWDAPVRMYTAKHGGFGPTDALVVKFTTGSVSSTKDLPHVTAGQHNSPPSSRTATLSNRPCDFDRQPSPGATIQGTTITAIFALGTGKAPNMGVVGPDFYPVLKTNTTYYLNIRNDPGAGCVALANCDMWVDVNKGAL